MFYRKMCCKISKMLMKAMFLCGSMYSRISSKDKGASCDVAIYMDAGIVKSWDYAADRSRRAGNVTMGVWF